jgi:hypothetical protein
MSNAKYSPDLLSKKYKIDRKRIYKWLIEHGIKKNGQLNGKGYSIDAKTAKLLIEWIKKAKDKTWTIASVAKRNNCSINKVCMWLKRNNYKYYLVGTKEKIKIENEFKNYQKTMAEIKKLKLRFTGMCIKYRISQYVLHNWLVDNNIRKKGDMYGRDYFINNKILKHFLDWYNNRKNIEKPNANSVAKRNGVSRQLVSVWAKINGVKKINNQYVFTVEQEKLFINRRKKKLNR